MAVGDVNSTERGSGARYNDGKPELELLPLSHLARYYWHRLDSKADQRQVRAVDALLMLGTWQATGERAALLKALERLDDDGQLDVDVANVFAYGRKKYAAWNWAKGMAWSIPTACAARHLRAIARGEYIDPVEQRGSGLPHRGHAGCNLMMLLTFMETYPEGDDRPRDLLARAA